MDILAGPHAFEGLFEGFPCGHYQRGRGVKGEMTEEEQPLSASPFLELSNKVANTLTQAEEQPARLKATRLGDRDRMKGNSKLKK